jgi:hypothetical protein
LVLPLPLGEGRGEGLLATSYEIALERFAEWRGTKQISEQHLVSLSHWERVGVRAYSQLVMKLLWCVLLSGGGTKQISEQHLVLPLPLGEGRGEGLLATCYEIALVRLLSGKGQTNIRATFGLPLPLGEGSG